jgi:arylsulfatase A-like enzyme
MDRPNILLITTDQQRFDTITALGNDHIFTPHLDWLVDEGIVYTRAYVDCPICMPARATIMTGRTAWNHGLVGNSERIRPMAELPTLPGLLTGAGYQTRAQGKMHFSPMRANYGFEHMELLMEYYRERARFGTGRPPKEHGVGENEMTPVISTVHETESLTHWTVRRSIDFLEARDDARPFFLWTSFAKPHPPFDPCANYWALYAHRDVPAPVRGDWSQRPEDVPQGFMRSTYRLNYAYRASDGQLKDSKRAYYACITQIDYQLGLLFARMRELGLLENTWILFTSDHGEMLGDHRMGAKSVFFEGAAHVPLIIRPPTGSLEADLHAASRVDVPVQPADLMPTLLSLAGIPTEEQPETDGTSLLGLVGAETPQTERTILGNCMDNCFAVIDSRWKYTWTSVGGGELFFDLREDPYETRNLAESPDHAEAAGRMRRLLIDELERRGSALVENGRLKPGPGIDGPDDTGRWPGFHSTELEVDVLH